VYTFFLPDARLAYDAIVNSFGQSVAGKVPLVMVTIVACLYAIAVYITHKNLKNLVFLIPCGIIAYLIMHFEANPNKHIHIPEYVLMVWLLYSVFSKDSSSRDVFVLIFVCTTALGVVDELEQGIHPSRFYGLTDMIVNSSSGLIGIFTVLGLKKLRAADWSWIAGLKEMKMLSALCLLGVAGVVIMCTYLFRVQAGGAFWGIYPTWLLAWNVLFLMAVPVGLIFTRIRLARKNIDESIIIAADDLKIARLWIMPMLIIIAYMNALIIFVSISGMQFR
jgi:hypothetical protein